MRLECIVGGGYEDRLVVKPGRHVTYGRNVFIPANRHKVHIHVVLNHKAGVTSGIAWGQEFALTDDEQGLEFQAL